MIYAAEAELAALCIPNQKIVPTRQTLIEMGWTQPTTPIQTDNTTAEDVANNYGPTATLVMLSGGTQKNRFYWDKGPNNWGDYHTKQHPPVYHKSKRPLFAGCAQILLHVLRAQRR